MTSSCGCATADAATSTSVLRREVLGNVAVAGAGRVCSPGAGTSPPQSWLLRVLSSDAVEQYYMPGHAKRPGPEIRAPGAPDFAPHIEELLQTAGVVDPQPNPTSITLCILRGRRPTRRRAHRWNFSRTGRQYQKDTAASSEGRSISGFARHWL